MVVDEPPLFIGGEWVPAASSKRFTVINAPTEEPIGSVPEAVEADVGRIVAAPRQAFDHSGWATSAPAERAARMTRFADAFEKRAADLAASVSMQNGMPITLSEGFEGGFAVGMLRYCAGLAASIEVEEKRPPQMGLETLVFRSPIGVCAAIVPWELSRLPAVEVDVR